MTIHINGSSKEIQKVVEVLGEHYKQEIFSVLLGFYHQLSHDSLTLDDLERVGARYGLELEKSYLELFMGVDEENEDVL